MAAWRASLGACGIVAATAGMAVAGSPIADLETLLKQQAAAGSAIAPIARRDDSLPWSPAVLERRDLRRVAVDPQAVTAPPAPAESDRDFHGSVGCVVAGTVGTTIAGLGGGLNTVNLIGGGIVSAINPVTFYVSLMGVVFVSFCQLGQALAPLYVYMTTPTPPAEPAIGVPQFLPQPPQPLDNLPDFRRGVPYESRPGVPMVRAVDRPAEWVPATPAAERRDCVQDRRSIRLAMSAITHGAAIPPRCSGSLI